MTTTFKRHQIVTVGIAGVHSQYRGRVIGRAKRADDGYWVVREIPADAERAAFFKHVSPRLLSMCVHESQLQAVGA